MTKKRNWPGILAIVLIFGMMLVGCDGGSTSSTSSTRIDRNDPQTFTYRGNDLAGNEYFLTILNDTRETISSNFGSFSMEIISGGKEVISGGTVTDIRDDNYTLSTPNGSAFIVTIRDDSISSIVGEIPLSNGSTFIVRTFEVIYLRAQRWTYHNGHFGQNYNSWSSVKLEDVYTGDYTDLMSTTWGDYSIFRISGTVDTKLDKVLLDMQFAPDDGSPWIYLGGGQDNHVEIGPGSFSVEVRVNSGYDVDFNALPDGEVIVSFVHQISNSAYENINEMEKIPDDVLDGTIMATIRNLKIEPIKTP